MADSSATESRAAAERPRRCSRGSIRAAVRLAAWLLAALAWFPGAARSQPCEGVERWARRCAELYGLALEVRHCAEGGFVLDVDTGGPGTQGPDSSALDAKLAIEVARDRPGAFAHAGELGLSPVGDFPDWSAEPAPRRAAFAAVLACAKELELRAPAGQFVAGPLGPPPPAAASAPTRFPYWLAGGLAGLALLATALALARPGRSRVERVVFLGVEHRAFRVLAGAALGLALLVIAGAAPLAAGFAAVLAVAAALAVERGSRAPLEAFFAFRSEARARRFAVAAGAAMVVLVAIALVFQSFTLSPTLAYMFTDQLAVADPDAPSLYPTPIDHAALRVFAFAPMTGGAMSLVRLLAGAIGGPAALLSVRLLFVAAFAGAAPFVFASARRRGVARAEAALLALLFALSPVVWSKLSRDFVFPAGGLVVLGYFGWVTRRPVLFVAAFALTPWCHPLAGVGPWLFCLHAWRTHPEPGARRLAGIAAAVLVAAGGVVVLGFFFAVPHVFGAHFDAARVPLHLLELVCLLGFVGFAPLGRAGLLVVLLPDALYYLFTPQGLDHGLITATPGMLAVVAVEALARERSAAAMRWQRGALFAAVVANLAALPTWNRAGLVRALFRASPPPTLLEAAAAPLEPNRRCFVQPSIVPAFVGRCATLVPYAHWDRVADLAPRPAAFVLAPERLRDRREGEHQVAYWDRAPAVLRALERELRAGGLRVRRFDARLVVLDSELGRAATDADLATLADLAGELEAAAAGAR